MVTYAMVIACFLLQDILKQAWFFEETFLLADTRMEVVFSLLFFTFLNINVCFIEKKLVWRSYIAAKTLSNTKSVEVICCKKFAASTLDSIKETFKVHVAVLKALEVAKSVIHPCRAAQVAFLQSDKAFTESASKYLD